jgi:two-component sensor histidine kinase
MELNDEVRLAALRDLAVLDTEPEAGFDDIVHLAAHLCAAPVALVSLIEADRQWFKARVGLEVCETSIEQSVCAHGLGSTDLLVIPDLTADPRTAANPLVTGAPSIRFYAGAPLVLPSGKIIGMLCVIDVVARPQGLSQQQRESLAALSRQVVAMLEARRLALLLNGEFARQLSPPAAPETSAEVATFRLNDSSIRLATEAGQIGTFDCDIATNQVLVSPEFCRVFGLPIAPSYVASEIESLIVEADAHTASSPQSRPQSAANGSVEYRIVRPSDGQLRWITRRGEYLYVDDVPVRLVGIVQDTTAQHLLNGEIAHRLKNTLALVQAIATSTLRSVVERDAVDRFFQRLSALAVGHDLLTQPATKDSSLGGIVEAIFDRLGEAHRVRLQGPALLVGPQSATTVSMVMHELATNALKHGCLRASDGYVDISWTVVEGLVALTWAEKGGPEVVQPTTRGFGARLITRGLIGSGDVETAFEKQGFRARMTAEWDRLAR